MFEQTWYSVVEYESDGTTNKHARTEKNSDYLICHVTSYKNKAEKPLRRNIYWAVTSQTCLNRVSIGSHPVWEGESKEERKTEDEKISRRIHVHKLKIRHSNSCDKSLEEVQQMQ